MLEGDEFFLVGLKYREHDDELRRIARILRSGEASQKFLAALADHLDPDAEKTLSDTKLVVRYRGAGAPPARPDRELGVYMYTQINIFGERLDLTLKDARRLFGAKRTACLEEFRRMRETCADDPAYREWLHTSAPLNRRLAELVRDLPEELRDECPADLLDGRYLPPR